MFIAAIVLASKFIEDSNKMTHAIHKFISPLYNSRELNEMERSFLGKYKHSFLFIYFNFNFSLLSLAVVKVPKNANYFMM
jgi:2-polyprenyl-3-methyl-5-hydroxy-6-metoxy-1,4-benzoquinol methylase